MSSEQRIPDQIYDFALVCDRLDSAQYPHDDDGQSLIEAERRTPVTVSLDSSVRPKILDKCGMTCNFCHNEGTPVAQAYQGSILLPNPRYKQGRVSVFAENNGVSFLPGQMQPDNAYRNSIASMALLMGSNDLHLTGGEPSLHPKLPQLISIARDEGYYVKITSNGENIAPVASACAAAGLKKINFSIFGTTADELAEVQHAKFKSSPLLAQAKINALKKSIDSCFENNISADANIVISNISHVERAINLINNFDSRLSVRLLNDLDVGQESYFAIYSLLSQINARPTETVVEAGSSNARVKYQLPNGRELYFKQIRRTTLPETCIDCKLNNDVDCKEGYYGVRLYIDQDKQYRVGVCLQRMDLTMTLDAFKSSSLPDEINAFRADEYGKMIKHFSQRAV